MSEKDKREIERLTKVAIKPRWASDLFAQAMAIDVIASYGSVAIPALIEISQKAASGATRKHALDRISQLKRKYPQGSEA